MVPPPLWDHMDEYDKMIVRQWAQNPNRRVVLKKNETGQYIAAALVNDTDHLESCCIDFIFVHPNSRRKGYASKLLSSIFKWDRATVFAYPYSEESRAFFKKHEFVPASYENGLAPLDWCETPLLLNNMWGRSNTR